MNNEQIYTEEMGFTKSAFEIKDTPLILVKWEGKYTQHRDGICLNKDVEYYTQEYPTTTVGFLIHEDDKMLILASSIYGINVPNSMAKHTIEIPKVYIINRELL